MTNQQYKFTIIAAALCLMTAFAFAQPAHGQTAQEKYDNAQKLFAEGVALAKANTVESKQAAIPKFEQARHLYQELNAQQEDVRQDEAYCLVLLGDINNSLGDKQKALDYYLQSLPLFRAVGNKEFEVSTLRSIGNIYSESGEKRKAIDYYAQSLPFLKLAGDENRQATALLNIGMLYSDLGEKQKALEYLLQAAPLYKLADEKNGEAATLNLIGLTYISLGDKQKALDFLAQSLSLYRLVADKGSEAITLLRIGTVYSALGEKQQALKFYKESLLLNRELKDKESEASSLNNIGDAYSYLGEKQLALKYFNESLAIHREVKDKHGEAIALNNIGKVYQELGEQQLALKYFNESLLIRREIKDKSGEATTLNNIGGVYSELGEKQQALKFYKESLLLFRAVGDKEGSAYSLSNIGTVYRDLGEQQQALEVYKESLSLRREIGDRFGEAQTLNNIGAVCDDFGEKQLALKFYDQSLSLRREIGDKDGEATTLINIGKIHADLGEKQLALKYLNEALPLLRSVSNNREVATTLNNLFVTLAAVNPRFAIFYGKQSVNNYQILRSNVQGLDKNLQQTFLKSIEYTYRNVADELITQGRYAEAQQILNAFKDQQFFDFNQNKQFALLALTTREAELTTTFNQKIETVVAATRALDEYKRGIGDRQPNADETAQIKSLEDKQTAANADYLAFLKSAEKEFAAPPDEKDKTPVVNDLTEMQTTLRELSAQTGEKSVAVYTLVGVDNYRALVVTSDSIFAVSTPIKGKLLNYKAQQLWAALKTWEYDPQPLAKDVYDVVFAPLAAKLPADTKTILWSLDGSLRYLPMAALHDGKKYLVEYYNNVVFTRADSERLTRNVSENLTGTGFGVSLGYNVKIENNVSILPKLSKVISELQQIFKSKNSPNGVLPGEVLLDKEFTRETMISTLQKRRPLVHIASHFVFKAGNEANSFLLLGDGSPFTLDEMKRQKDLFAGVDLLTLSACETAAQREDSSGREIDGFAELAQRLGAGAVIASLWSVNDGSTGELMEQFYKNYDSQKGMNKADSLRTAQLYLLSGEYEKTDKSTRRPVRAENAGTENEIKLDISKLKPFDKRKNPLYTHPFFWSPFILVGNWK